MGCFFWKLWDIEYFINDRLPSEAIFLNEYPFSTEKINKLAECTSCIDLLEEIEQVYTTEHEFDNKGDFKELKMRKREYELTEKNKKFLKELERRFFAGAKIESIKNGDHSSPKREKSIARSTVNVTLKKRNLILQRDNYKCIFCNSDSQKIEINHIIPVSIIMKLNLDKNLLNGDFNLCTTCFNCNRGKSDNLSLIDISFYLEKFKDTSHPNHNIVKFLNHIKYLQNIDL